jgi:hypothetical protein
MNFKQYLKIIEQNTVGTHNDFATGALLSSSWTDSESASEKTLPWLPSTDLSIPSVVRTSFITNIIKNTNPIIIEMKDGTKLYLDIDQYNRIGKTPEIGQRITVSFQRSPTDATNQPSKIEKIEIN